MQYRNREIEDTIWTEASQFVRLVLCSYDGLDLSSSDLGDLRQKLTDKQTELDNSASRELGVQHKDLRIRIYTDEGEHDYSPHAEICIVWDESESTEQRDKRIEKAKAKIDKDIERYEKKKAEKAAAEEQRKNDEITKAMEVLVKAGYTVSK